MFDENLRPVPQKNVDYKSLPLAPTPEEYFLLSRIDGNLTIAALCSISGLSRDATMTALDRLRQAGLISIPGTFGEEKVSTEAPAQSPAPASTPSSPPPSSSSSPPSRPAPSPQPIVSQPAAPSAPEPSAPEPPKASRYTSWPTPLEDFAFPADVLGEPGDLDETTRRDLIYRHAHIDVVDYYQFFGVARDAPRKQVRDAYFTLSKQYHPDLFYGKEIGSYRGRVEAIFRHLNKVNQVLSHKKKRATYDQEHPESMAAAPEASVGAGASSSASVGEQHSQSQGGGLGASQSSHGEVDERKREIAFGTLIKRAEKHEAAGDYAAAAHEYKSAFGIKPDAAVALRAANLLMRCGEEHLDAAVALARQAAAREPRNGKPLLLIGDAYEEKGDYANARHYYQQAQRLEPSNKIIARRLKYLEAASR